VFLNRAPTLHRLGIQAFEPVLVEGKAIQIHPLVCTAFNADFDGDQMAVHLPLSAEAQAEARILMLSAHNILSPAHGRPITVPTQDMIIGAYYLTETTENQRGEGRTFASLDEAMLAYDERLFPTSNGGRSEDDPRGLALHAKIKVRVPAGRFPEGEFPVRDEEHPDAIVLRRSGSNGDGSVLVETTLGRLIFNEAFPSDFPFHDAPVKKRDLTELASKLVELYPRAVVADSLDKMKDLGFEYATRSALTISISDVKTPVAKRALLDQFEDEADKVETQFDRGIITDEERRQKEIEVWTEATFRVRDAVQDEMHSEKFNPIDMMVGSGARGDLLQVQQIAGMRGLVANPRGEIIPRPIKSSFREGLSVLEYFISTHGARKGLADTALRTADSGYLTRRLVDVAQELIVREDDCESARGIWVESVTDDPESLRVLETKLLGRCLSEDVTLTDGSTLPRNTEVREPELRALAADPGLDRVRVRSVLTCESLKGVCALCYGTMLATNKLVDQGEAIGIIAAQSIGEPGTQLTMRTFHTGGVAGEDITHGLPRVVELFEARTPKGAAVMAGISGVVRIGENEKGERVLTIIGDDGSEEAHVVTRRTHLFPGIVDGSEVVAGAQLTGDSKTPVDPKQILEVKGVRETQQYLVDEVQKVYREQGVSIHDKHIEVIVRQMLRRVNVSEPGDSRWLPGQQAEARLFADINRHLVAEGQQPAEGRPVLMGITKASLATDSWLSAASFQETTRVLTEAAIEGRSDGLVGLKENVIIGKLIPAGTGMPRYRDIATNAPDYEPLPFYSSDADAEGDLDLAAWLADTSGTTLDDDVAAFTAAGSGGSESAFDQVDDDAIAQLVGQALEAIADASPSPSPLPLAEPEPEVEIERNGEVGEMPPATDDFGDAAAT
ncbi:MAG TPA: DNA-directed RNA polymerase subunit beta', partial [Acidimicrobiia bacterium]